MKRTSILRYFHKWMPLIIILCVVMTALLYVMFSRMQTYTASVVIQYTNDQAEYGYTPTGAVLDTSEIYSSTVMAKVISNLGLDTKSYNIDKLRACVSVTPVTTAADQSLEKARLEKGEEVDTKPTTYIVSFTVGHSESLVFARTVLDEIMDVYYEQYNETYINSFGSMNVTSGIYDMNYDYIEMMETIDSAVSNTVDDLWSRASGNQYFRSSETGYTFTDICYEFEMIEKSEIPKIFADILINQISKDRPLLIDKYASLIEEENQIMAVDKLSVDDTDGVIDAYVAKMRDSGNTDLSYLYILDEVYDDWRYDSDGNLIDQGETKTVEYEKLLNTWIQNRENYEYALIQKNYYGDIADSFQKTDVIASDREGEIYDRIKQLVGKLDGLYQIFEKTNEEYNAYLGAQSIDVLSSLSVYEGININLYTSIGALFFLVLGCGVAIILGRMSDVIDYLFFTDHLTRLPNHIACDRFIEQESKHLLPDGYACIILTILNMQHINQVEGRAAGDGLLLQVAEFQKDLFSQSKKKFLCYNGSSKFIIFVDRAPFDVITSEVSRIHAAFNNRDSAKRVDVLYSVGIAETSHDAVYDIKKLISSASMNQNAYRAEAAETTTDKESQA